MGVITKAALSPHLFYDPDCWSSQSQTQGPPAWKPDAQPTLATGVLSFELYNNYYSTVGEIMMQHKNQHTSMNEVQLHQESGLYKYPVTQDFSVSAGHWKND